MKTSVRYLSVSLLLLALGAPGAFADIRINLIKGKRTVKDTVSFTIEVSHEKNEKPRYHDKPEFVEISAEFAEPASGVILLDRQGVQRFDGSARVKGQRTEITYGRHVVTVQVSAPAVATDLTVFVRGGLVREVIGTAAARAPAVAAPPKKSTAERLADCQKRVTALETEIEVLKRDRREP
jgi:hypothetical protein